MMLSNFWRPLPSDAWVPPGRWRRRVLAGLGYLAFAALCVLLGLTVGVMVVIMPPLAWIGMMALALLFLLWVLPDLPHIPDKVLRRLLFISLAVQIVTPAYYAIAVPGLPWVSMRRLFWFPTIAVAALMIAGSSEMRSRIAAILGDAKSMVLPCVGFFLWICVSTLTSLSWTNTISDVINSFLYWAMAFMVCVMCMRGEGDIRLIMRILCLVALIAGPMGLLETLLQKRFILDAWPDVLLQELYRRNPILLENLSRDTFRNGEFRANFIYQVSLSYAEFLAICGPICMFFALHARTTAGRCLGAVSLIACVVGVYASGARGGYMALAIAVPFVATLWLIRHIRENPNSMAGVIAAVSFGGAVLGFMSLLVVWKRLRWKFTGGYEGVSSTDVRMLQWEMALPSIKANPVTGYGHGAGGVVVGYVTPGGTPTVDSYIITLLVDAGVPALIFFFGMFIAAVILLVRVYLTDKNPASVCSSALAGALLSFVVYRGVLTQSENHFLAFVLLGFAVLQVSASKRRQMATQRDEKRHPAHGLDCVLPVYSRGFRPGSSAREA